MMKKDREGEFEWLKLMLATANHAEKKAERMRKSYEKELKEASEVFPGIELDMMGVEVE